MRSLTTIATAGMICVSTAALAGPLTSSRVSEDANFVVHIDLEGMAETEAGEFILSMLMEEGLDELDEVEDELGFNPLESLHDITVSAGSTDGDDAVIIATGHEDLLDALDRLSEEAGDVDRRSSRGVDFTQYMMDDESMNVWVDEGRRGVTIVASQDSRALVNAVRTLQGDSDGADLDERAFRGAFVVAIANSLEELEDMGDAGPASAILQMSKGAMLTVGDDDGNLLVRAMVHAQDDEKADALVNMLQGVIAFAQMAAAEELEEQGVGDLLNGLNFDTDGGTVSVELSVDPRSLAEFMDK